MLDIVGQISSEFPNATVRASTFDQYITLLQPFASQLPVIEQEIGDTW